MRIASACLSPLAALLLTCSPLTALASPATLADCAAIADDSKRLRCFDGLAVAPSPAQNTEAALASNSHEALAAHPRVPEATSTDRTTLAQHWELGPEDKRGAFIPRQHLANYLIATYNDSPNSAPYRPFQRIAPGTGKLSNAELAFQLGFKMKLLENTLGSPVDLWFGYTQRSFWQADNHKASSPFRESNYQPELMAVVPLDFELLGLRARFVNFGLVHQSNGQASTLSRSWNRGYAQLGMERGDLVLLARLWKRLAETGSDDNPDIMKFMGYGDLSGTYRWEGHEFSALTRYNLQTHKGAVQLGWAFPIANKLKGYLQVFSGYGQSLIDYNHAQNTVGLGFLVNF